MRAFADMVSGDRHEGFSGWGHGRGGEAGLSVEGIDRGSVPCREVFAMGVGPLVFQGAGHVKRPRGDQGQKLMLVDRKGFLTVVVSFKVVAEPVGEGVVDPFGRFTELAAKEGGPPRIPNCWK